MGLSILHLSDLHIGEKKKITDLNSLAADIAIAAGKVFNVIIVTGDIFDGKALAESNYKEYIENAISFFDELIKTLNENCKSELSRETVYFVPGNHEINLNKIRNESGDRYQQYKEFLRLFYGDNFPTCYNQQHLSIVKAYEEEKVMLVGFCSPEYCLKIDKQGNYLEKGDENNYESFGVISSPQILTVEQMIRAIPDHEEYNIVGFLHHHFYLMEERDKGYVDSSALRDSEKFMRTLNRFNYIAVLHGHKHEAINRRMNINLNISEPEKIVTILGCGSTYKGEIYTNAINAIEVFRPGSSYELKFIEYEKTRSDFLPKPEVYLPFYSSKTAAMDIQEILNRYPNTEIKYHQLNRIDTKTNCIELHELLHKTVCSLGVMIQSLQEDEMLIIALLGSMHYRSNLRYQNGNHLQSILNFMNPLFERCFHDEQSSLEKMLNERNIYLLSSNYVTFKDHYRLSENQKKCLAFLTIGILLTEFYMTLKDDPESFFEIRAAGKSSFKYEAGTIHQHIEGNNILFSVNEDRRSLTVRVVCTNAEAHRMISLIIKEIEQILTPFEKDFARYGFRVYYVFPELSKLIENNEIKLESYLFSAYIPTLIPLLAGENIYSQPEAFARELIQNAIDAINVRMESIRETGEEFDTTISLRLGQEDGNQYFEINDNGSGMDKYVLERYLTTVGRSYYASPEFTGLNLAYKPISQFGIGFLSCFMLGKHVIVNTRHHIDDIPYILDIPNYDGCFFIEQGQREQPGTKIRVYENIDFRNIDEKRFVADKIKRYIQENILNIPFDIVLNGNKFIPSFGFYKHIKNKTRLYGLYIYIPMEIVKNEKGEIHFLVIDTDELTPYGILFYKRDMDIMRMPTYSVMNSGVAIKNYDAVKGSLNDLSNYYDICANMPSCSLSLSVSRDELKGFGDNVNWKVIKQEFNKRQQEVLATEKLHTLPLFVFEKIDPLQYKIHMHEKIIVIMPSIEINKLNIRLLDTIEKEVYSEYRIRTIERILELLLGKTLHDVRFLGDLAILEKEILINGVNGDFDSKVVWYIIQLLDANGINFAYIKSAVKRILHSYKQQQQLISMLKRNQELQNSSYVDKYFDIRHYIGNDDVIDYTKDKDTIMARIGRPFSKRNRLPFKMNWDVRCFFDEQIGWDIIKQVQFRCWCVIDHLLSIFDNESELRDGREVFVQSIIRLYFDIVNSFLNCSSFKALSDGIEIDLELLNFPSKEINR